jgi:hypothetical protein
MKGQDHILAESGTRPQKVSRQFYSARARSPTF